MVRSQSNKKPIDCLLGVLVSNRGLPFSLLTLLFSGVIDLL
jgi:hypothetical protein